jgi:uncharacterized protein
LIDLKFEFDPAKSAANKAKHGIDFVEAQLLWQDEDGVFGPARAGTEDRLLLTASFGERLWTACYTMRGTPIRLISIRRARKEERLDYEQANERRLGVGDAGR